MINVFGLPYDICFDTPEDKEPTLDDLPDIDPLEGEDEEDDLPDDVLSGMIGFEANDEDSED